MDIFNYTNNRLIERSFRAINILEIQSLGAVVYQSDINIVVVKKIHSDLDIKNIRTLSINIRSILLDRNMNVCNSYLILCVNETIDYETFFTIERDTRAIRKYVVRSSVDLNRIPFLDSLIEGLTTESEENRTSNKTENIYVNELVNLISSYNGNEKKLSTEEINNSANLILDLVEKNYEIK
jgi:hypothetical protein